MNQSTCSIDGCEKPVLGRGWCNMHYSRWRRNGDVNDPGRKVRYCTIDGCEKPRAAHGLCMMHHLRKIRGTKNATEPGPLRIYADACKVVGCERPYSGLGYCSLHEQRFRKHGDPGPLGLTRWGNRTCSAAGCDDQHHANGFCAFHNKHAGAETSRPCSRCGDAIDMMERNAAGRKRHGSTLMCRDCLRARTSRSKWSAKAIAARDESPECRLCGVDVDLSVRFPDPMSGSVDHILPVSRGGANDLDNLQLAHLVCNMRKGANLDYVIVPQGQ